jgi:NADPH:quinone reductase-like Zn-dependent oxidoreductase
MTNRRVLIKRSGGPERLRVVTEDIPVPQRGQARIRNEACGVAYADVLIREGLYPGVRLPATPGYEAVGVVDAVGPEVDRVAMGARVAALTVTGGYARYVCVPAADIVPVPPALTAPQAAALVLNGITAYQMLVRVAPYARLRTILVHGAAGGVGSILLDLARWRGIKAFGTCSAGKAAFVREKGGTAIDYRAGDIVRNVMKQTDGVGVDAVFDGLGGATTSKSFKALASGGMCVVFGAQGALQAGRGNPFTLARSYLMQPRFSALNMMLSNRGLAGYMIEAWKRARHDLYREDLASVFALAAEGHVQPVISKVFGLDEAPDAHTAMNEARHIGKLIIDPWR